MYTISKRIQIGSVRRAVASLIRQLSSKARGVPNHGNATVTTSTKPSPGLSSSVRRIASLSVAALLVLSVGCKPSTAHASPVVLAEETQIVVKDMQGMEQQVFQTLQTNLGKVQGLSQQLRDNPENPQNRDATIATLQEVTKSFQDLSNHRDDFRKQLQSKLERLKELEGSANNAIQELQARHTELAQTIGTSESSDPTIVAARKEAFQQAQGYVDEQIRIWNQFIDTHVAIQSELGNIDQRIETFLSMIDATAVVYREALNLVKLQNDVRWALSLVTEDLPHMAQITEDMRTSWGTVDSLVSALVNLSEPEATVTADTTASPLSTVAP